MPYTPSTGPRPEDLQPNNFTPAGNGYASETELTTVYQRPIAERTYLFERHMSYVGFSTMLEAMGFVNGANTPTIGHYESPWTEDVVTVGSIITASTGPGTDVVIALHADNMYDTGVTASGSARKTSYVQTHDVLELFDRTQVQVTNKNVTTDPHRITLTPLNSTVDLVGKITANDEYGILYNAHAEGSGLPYGRAPRIIKYSNTFGLVKHAFGSTGHELTNSVYHELIPGDPSSANQSIYVRIKFDELKRYEMSKSNMLLLGQTNDNLTEVSAGTGLDTAITTTEGFVDFALTNGTQDGYTVGTYTIADFDTLADIYYDERVASSGDILTYDGPTISKETENSFTNTLQQNLIFAVDRIMPGYAEARQYHEKIDSGTPGAEATVSFGYSCIHKNGFNFHMKRLSEFNDVKRAGSASYAYRNYRIAVPYGWMQDSLSGNERATIGYEYKKQGNYSRQDVYGTFAGAGVGGANTPYGQASHGVDKLDAFLISHIAGHWAVGNGCIVQLPA